MKKGILILAVVILAFGAVLLMSRRETPDNAAPATVSGSLTVSFSTAEDGVSVSFSPQEEAQKPSASSERDELNAQWDGAVGQAADTVVASLIVPDVLSNGVGLRKFISRVIEIAQGEPQFPVVNGTTPYGELFGTPKAEWCTEFCMYCLRQAEDELGTAFIGDVYPWCDCAWDAGLWFKRRGRYYDGGSDYIPAKGDLIIFDTQNLGYPNHTGMVIDVLREGNDIRIVTIEGNIPEDEVKQIRSRTLAVDDSTILGYCSTTKTHEYTGSLTDFRK